MKTFASIIDEINGTLTAEQIQLIKDTINYGSWGDTEMGFSDGNGGCVSEYAYGYCTNDAKRAGHFTGRQVSAMFRSIYAKLGMNQYKGDGMNEYFCHVSDWWGDGSGDMFFIRNHGIDGECLVDMFENWAKA